MRMATGTMEILDPFRSKQNSVLVGLTVPLMLACVRMLVIAVCLEIKRDTRVLPFLPHFEFRLTCSSKTLVCGVGWEGGREWYCHLHFFAVPFSRAGFRVIGYIGVSPCRFHALNDSPELVQAGSEAVLVRPN